LKILFFFVFFLIIFGKQILAHWLLGSILEIGTGENMVKNQSKMAENFGSLWSCWIGPAYAGKKLQTKII